MERLTVKNIPGYHANIKYLSKDPNSIFDCLNKLGEYEDAEEKGLLLRKEESERIINADEWIEKLSEEMKVAPGEYADYLIHLINEIEAEVNRQAQEGE